MKPNRSTARYVASLPERVLRAIAAAVGGAIYEAAQLLLPRFVRRSRLYEVTAKNALRLAIELVGGVASVEAPDASNQPGLRRLAVRKAVGNVAEVGTFAAFGFSPLWLLAGAADVLNGSRVYLRALEAELIGAGVLAEGARFSSLDQLLGAFGGTTGTTAALIDLPPLELAELKHSLNELRSSAGSLPTASELASLFEGLRRKAASEGSSVLEVSSGIGLALLTSARHVGRHHLVTPWREDWAPLRNEGFAAYNARVGRRYRDAVAGHFNPAQVTLTERIAGWTQQALAWTVRRGRGSS